MNKWIVSFSGCALVALASLACAQQPSAAPAAGSDPVVARIGAEEITESQLEAMVGASLVNLRQQVYQAKLSGLNEEIFNRLVREAATAEGLTSTDYLKKHIDDKLAEPTEAEIEKVMTQFRSRLAPEDAQARQQVLEYLSQQAKVQHQEALRKKLFSEAGVRILLEPPRVTVAIGDGTPTRGSADAPLVLVEYTDYQCPYCGRVQPTLAQIMERYEGQVLHVFKNLPLPNHKQAKLAAEAALCAQDQGKYWEFHDWLFANQRTMNRDSMVAEAGELELDTDLFSACIEQGTYADKIAADMREARSFGITGTPGFLINGRVLSGAQPLEAFEAILDQELERKGLPVPKKKAAEGATEKQGAEEAGSTP